MGFLDHSTNNIIVDAVLTDLGRQALANGTFEIAQFSLADDEVDYGIIRKFGRTVGKEKIIKNTPIYEAQTTATQALKYRLLSLSDPTLIYLPTVTIDNPNVTLSLSTPGNSQATVRVSQVFPAGFANSGATDGTFYVEVPNTFLSLVGNGSSIIESFTQTALYTLQQTSTNAGAPYLDITLAARGLDDTVFNTFGTTSSKNRIDCIVSVIGKSTGIRATINVSITK